MTMAEGAHVREMRCDCRGCHRVVVVILVFVHLCYLVEAKVADTNHAFVAKAGAFDDVGGTPRAVDESCIWFVSNLTER
jgi:hypothetical protein